MLDPQAQALLQLMKDRGVPELNALPVLEARDYYLVRKALTQPDPLPTSVCKDHALARCANTGPWVCRPNKCCLLWFTTTAVVG